MTRQATSADGTVIGYEVVGDGPPLLVVHGIAADRSQWGVVSEALAKRFTVHLLDRRGRGLSAGESGEYSIDREGEDIAAVVEAIGRPTFAFGHGHGGLCVLKGALISDGFERLLIDETPAGKPGPDLLPEVAEGMAAAIERGSPDDALFLFLRDVVGLQEDQIAGIRDTPMWQTRVKTAHTIARELQAANGYQRESAKLGQLEVPVRFVIGKDSTEYMKGATDAIHADMPAGELIVVDGRMFTTMYSDADAVVRELEEYFLG